MATTPGRQSFFEQSRPSLTGEGKVSQAQRRTAVAVIACLVTICVCVTPFAHIMLMPSPGYAAAHSAGIFTLSLMLSTLLFSKGSIENHSDSIRLGYAYFFLATITIVRTVSIPNAYIPGYLIGERYSSLWLWLFRHAGFGLLIGYYAWRAIRTPLATRSLKLMLPAIVVLTLALTLIATLWIHILPLLTRADGSWISNRNIAAAAVFAIDAAALFMVMRLRWRTPEQLWVAVAMGAACLEIWLTTWGVHRYSVGWYVAKVSNLVTILVLLISHFYELTALYNRVAKINTLLKELANKDGLTGLDNRRRFDEFLEYEWKRARRDKRVLSLLMIDVDHFKKYNDGYGHVQGDECLRQIASRLTAIVQRGTDLTARYGGEEFAVILPATDAAGAACVAQKLLEGVRTLGIPHKLNPPRHVITLSIGMASVVPDSPSGVGALIEHADAALYAAKAGGRDRAESTPLAATAEGKGDNRPHALHRRQTASNR